MRNVLDIKIWDINEKTFVDIYSIDEHLVHVAIGDQCYLVNNKSAIEKAEKEKRKIEFRKEPEEVTDEFKIFHYTHMNDNFGNKIYDGSILDVDSTLFSSSGLHHVFFFKGSYVTASNLFSDLSKANKYSLDYMIERGAKVIGHICETEGFEQFI